MKRDGTPRKIDTQIRGGRPKTIGIAEQILCRMASEFPQAICEESTPRYGWQSEDLVDFLREEFKDILKIPANAPGSHARFAKLIRDRIDYGTPAGADA